MFIIDILAVSTARSYPLVARASRGPSISAPRRAENSSIKCRADGSKPSAGQRADLEAVLIRIRAGNLPSGPDLNGILIEKPSKSARRPAEGFDPSARTGLPRWAAHTSYVAISAQACWLLPRSDRALALHC
jgi:hypothetical protein